MNMNQTNFYSIDKLVEFGMSVAVANQMVKSMNHALDNMKIPGAGTPDQIGKKKAETVYFAVIMGESKGPYSLTELSRYIADGLITSDTLVWKPGMESWDKAQNITEILELVALTPPPMPE